MPALADRTFNELLADVAAESPAPGGGACAALATALAAGLVEMSAAFSEQGDVQARASQLRAQALELAERDLSAYAPVLAAVRLPAEDPERAGRLKAALSDAAEPPLAVATVAAELARLAAGTARDGSRWLVGDAAAGALLAEAACRAAVNLVAINLARQPADGRLAEATALASQAAAAREEALG